MNGTLTEDEKGLNRLYKDGSGGLILGFNHCDTYIQIKWKYYGFCEQEPILSLPSIDGMKSFYDLFHDKKRINQLKHFSAAAWILLMEIHIRVPG